MIRGKKIHQRKRPCERNEIKAAKAKEKQVKEVEKTTSFFRCLSGYTFSMHNDVLLQLGFLSINHLKMKIVVLNSAPSSLLSLETVTSDNS